MGEKLDRTLRRLLMESGCTFVPQTKGSHEMWFSPISGHHFVVPAGIVSRHTANAILRQAGLPKAF